MDLSGAKFRKSTRSGADNACVEVADLEGGARAVRHSKTPDGAVIVYSAPEWEAFIGGVKDGEFD